MTCQLFLLATALAVAGAFSFLLRPASEKLTKRDSALCQRYQDCVNPLTDPDRNESVCVSIKERDMNCEDDILSSCSGEGERRVLDYMTWVDNVEYSCQPEVKAELQRQYECLWPNIDKINNAEIDCWNRTCPECQSQDQSCQSVYMSRGCLTWSINQYCPGAETFHYDYYSHYYTRMARHLNCTWP